MSYQAMMIKDLQDLYQAESEQARELPELARMAEDAGLRSLLDEHAAETQRQALRLSQILAMVGQTTGGTGEVTPAVHGLVSEAEEKAQQFEDRPLRDLALIAAAQKMEHYEIACYGTARAMARTAGLDEAARLLQTSLQEEEAADKRLRDVALPIHKRAAAQEPAIPQ